MPKFHAGLCELCSHGHFIGAYDLQMKFKFRFIKISPIPNAISKFPCPFHKGFR